MDSLRSIWNQMPVVRLLLPFMAGIGICIGLDTILLFFLLLLVICLGAIIYINQLKETVNVYRWRYASGIAISMVMLSAGYVVTYFNTERLNPHHFSTLNVGDEVLYKGIIADPIVVKEKVVNALIEIKVLSRDDSSQVVSGKVLASLVRNERSEALRYGDEIIFTGKVKEYDEPKNPDQFNYKRYQSLHHIYHRVYLNTDEWRVTSGGHGNFLLSKIYQVRTYFLSLIKREVSGENELAVATAIMLGYRDYVTDDVIQAYAGSGVLHVLSVSGLHVAVLYFVLNILLGWMDRRRRLQIIKGVLVIIIMLFYAGITGLSPPVLRSVWMFSLITIAVLLDRDVSIYNVLAVSCLLLLLWDPYYITDVGFQLSYIAVVGIVYIYPMLFDLIENTNILRTKMGWINFSANWLMRWTWGLICVSIAAQIATFPISIFYFHQFPNYFLLSNLLVIPLSNFVLISGMLLFVTGWSERLLSYVGWVFDHLLVALNKVVFGIDALPFALSKGVVLTSFEMILSYAVILMVCWYLADRRAKVLITGLSLLLILCTSFSIHNIGNQNKRELAVYSIKGMKAISVIDKGAVYYDFDSALIHDDKLMRNNILNHWYASGVKAQVSLDNMSGCYTLPFGKIFEVEGKRILAMDNKIRVPPDVKLKVDVLILSKGAGSIRESSDHISFSQVVFDTSNRPKQIIKWIAECDELKIKYHDCRERAFVMEW
ncbi:MAG: hypothetical protein JWO03_1902 [Bacteroidetes bacterium]|nr:hypothetical protein [Bacteroidota bacterium]